MRTLAEPKQNIVKLWGKQTVKPEETYRLMRYVLRVDHEGKTALHNVVTGQLVVLDPGEVQAVDTLPAGYAPVMDALIADHYLVPDDYDEHKQVVNLRTILRSLMPKSKYITHYTILPTTACNARCYYCFEQGIKPITMTEETADQVVRFIAERCGPEKRITITWFGGEPTVASNRIDQICEGLQKEEISYSSTMYTNGYLMDEMMVSKATKLWHLAHVQMSVDGTEKIFNKTKAFVNVRDNPYQRVIRNVGKMLDQKIGVAIRMNVDYFNHEDFPELVNELVARFGNNPCLNVYAYYLIGVYSDHDGKVSHADSDWQTQKVIQLNDFAREANVAYASKRLPILNYRGCMGDDESKVVITAQGKLVKCLQQIEDDQQVGDLEVGVINGKLVHKWHQVADYPRCIQCVYFPNCVKLECCGGQDSCYLQDRNHQYIKRIREFVTDCVLKGG